MPPKKPENNEHKKCLCNNTKSESTLSKSKPICVSSNIKITRSDQRISRTEKFKSNSANSKTILRNSTDKSGGDQYKSTTRAEKVSETYINIQSNNNKDKRKELRKPPHFITDNKISANPEAWKFWMLYAKEPKSMKSLHANTMSVMPVPKSPGGMPGNKLKNEVVKRASSSKPPTQQKPPAPSKPNKVDASKTVSTLDAASDKTKEMPVSKQIVQAKPSTSTPPKSAQTKSTVSPTKETTGGKSSEQLLNKQGLVAKTIDSTSDMKLPPKTENSEKPKSRNTIFSTLQKQFDSTTVRGRANTMAGGDSVDEAQFKGLSKYFNGQTNRGRANVAKATYAAVGVLILYFSLRPSKK